MRDPFATERRMLLSWPVRGLITAAATVLFLVSFFLIEDGAHVDSMRSLRCQSVVESLGEPIDTEVTSHSTTRRTSAATSCLDPHGPQPFILMSIGRSGSASTFQILGNLTGEETPSEEYTGSDPIRSTRFFSHIQNDGGLWVSENLCKKQQLHPDAGLVGFKWKPWKSIYSEPARDGLNFITHSQNPTIKIVRLRRNLLDVYLSGLKHHAKQGVKAHCPAGDEVCARKHRQAGTNMTVPVDDALAFLKSMTKQEDDVDALLDSMNVPHVHVTYDKLYHEDNADEWMKIFSFLNVGPTEGLALQQVKDAMGMESTSNAHHRDTAFNFDELKQALVGTKYENLLHR